MSYCSSALAKDIPWQNYDYVKILSILDNMTKLLLITIIVSKAFSPQSLLLDNFQNKSLKSINAAPCLLDHDGL